MKNLAGLTYESAKYLAASNTKLTRLPVEKISHGPDGKEIKRTFFVSMEQVIVSLIHKSSGDLVIFTLTTMGKRTTVTRKTTLPLEMIRNLKPTGDAMIAKPRPAMGMSLEDAKANVARMLENPGTLTIDALFTAAAPVEA